MEDPEHDIRGETMNHHLYGAVPPRLPCVRPMAGTLQVTVNTKQRKLVSPGPLYSRHGVRIINERLWHKTHRLTEKKGGEGWAAEEAMNLEVAGFSIWQGLVICWQQQALYQQRAFHISSEQRQRLPLIPEGGLISGFSFAHKLLFLCPSSHYCSVFTA